MPAVHVRITDAATNQPLAVRLRATDSTGRDCVPFGRPAVFRTGPGEDVGGQIRDPNGRWDYVDGGTEMQIAAGPVRIFVSHGPEYRALLYNGEVTSGQLAVRLQVERWTDERSQGWYSGDVAAFEIDPFSALLEGAAEDLAVVNVLARESDVGDAVRVSNLGAFSGADAVLQRPGHLVAVGTANEHPQLAALVLLGCHRPVFPLRCGVPDGRLDWSLIDWCAQARRKKDGLAVWRERQRGELEGEVIAAALLGKVDALAISDTRTPTWALWYALLNVGVRFPLVGASSKESNATALGFWLRTYARLLPAEEFSYPAWLRAVRAGRTYATSAPLLSLGAGGVGPGGVLTLAPGAAVPVSFESRSTVPYEALELLHNGEVIATVPESRRPWREPSGRLHTQLVVEVPIHHSGWLAGRCVIQGIPIAHTSPVYIEVAGSPPVTPRDEVAGLRAILDETRQWALAHPGPHDERFRQQLLANLDAAERRLTAT